MIKFAAVLLVGLAVGSTATASVAWRVFATGTDNGSFSTYASANAGVVNPTALAVRAIGPVESVSWMLSCDGETKGGRLSGKVLTVSVNAAKKCTVYGSAFGEAGTLRLQLLRR